MRVRVARKTIEALDICGFDLVAAGPAALPPFSAGAHIDVHLPNGLTRQYSLCNAETERNRYRIAVLKEPASRGGSKSIHEQVQVGDELEIGEPKNNFRL